MAVLGRLAGLTICILFVAGVGCSSGPPKGTVSGTVTYQGKPVSEGELHVNHKDAGVGAIAPLDGSGRFTFEVPLQAGEYAASVLPPPVVPVPNAPPPKVKHYADIPLKARDFKTSGLIITVKAGKNDINIELKD